MNKTGCFTHPFSGGEHSDIAILQTTMDGFFQNPQWAPSDQLLFHHAVIS
jgi:hypothetical protein